MAKLVLNPTVFKDCPNLSLLICEMGFAPIALPFAQGSPDHRRPGAWRSFGKVSADPLSAVRWQEVSFCVRALLTWRVTSELGNPHCLWSEENHTLQQGPRGLGSYTARIQSNAEGGRGAAPEEMELSPCFLMPRHEHLRQPQCKFDGEPAKQGKTSTEMPRPVGRLPATLNEKHAGEKQELVVNIHYPLGFLMRESAVLWAPQVMQQKKQEHYS